MISRCHSTLESHASPKHEPVLMRQSGSSSSCLSSRSSLVSPLYLLTPSHESMKNIVRSLWTRIATLNNVIDHAPTHSTEIYRTLKPPFPRSHPQTWPFLQ